VSPAVTVLFLGGLGRSGSTLVERTLARSDGVVAVGELVFLWERGVADDERCGCGEPFSACPFWQAVGARAFGGWNQLDLDRVRALQRRVDRNRYVPLLLAPWLWPPFAVRHRRYAAMIGRIYDAVAAESGASVIVDSSKHASTATLVRRVPGVRPRIAQIVRDPRGVAYSWTKHVERPDAPRGGSTMARVGPRRIAARWHVYNLLLELVRRPRRGGRLRYESFVADPARGVRTLLTFAGATLAEPGAALEGTSLTLDVDHTVAGNRLRFRTGTIEIRSDDEWRGRLPARSRSLVQALTWPLRVVYGYR